MTPPKANPGRELLKHLPLLDRIARSYAARTPPHVQYDDIRSVALQALAVALSKNAGRREILPAYAAQRIRGAILDYFRGGPAWRRYHGPIELVYLDSDPQGAAHSLRETLPDKRPGPREAVAKKELRATLRRQKSRLAARDKRILEMYYYQGYKLKQIASIYGCGASNISQILKRVLSQMRTLLEEELHPNASPQKNYEKN